MLMGHMSSVKISCIFLIYLFPSLLPFHSLSHLSSVGQPPKVIVHSLFPTDWCKDCILLKCVCVSKAQVDHMLEMGLFFIFKDQVDLENQVSSSLIWFLLHRFKILHCEVELCLPLVSLSTTSHRGLFLLSLR